MRYLILLLLSLPAQADTLIAICENMNAIRNNGAINPGTDRRGKFNTVTGGGQFLENGNKGMIAIASREGWEDLEQLPFVTVTSYEEIFGYRVQRTDENGQPVTEAQVIPESTYQPPCQATWVESGVDEFGFPAYVSGEPDCPDPVTIPETTVQVPVYDTVPGDPAMLNLYQSIYDYQTPDENGNTPSKFFMILDPKDMEDVL